MPENMVNGFNINGNPVPYNYDSLGNKLEKTSIAREYSNIETYDVDEYVIYNGKMYRCKQQILAGESFDSTKWDECSVGTEFNYIKGLINGTQADNVRFIDENLSITVGGTTSLQNTVLYPAYGLGNGDYLLGKNGVVAVISQFNKTSDTEYQATATTLFVITAAGSGNLPSSSVEDAGKFLQVDSSGSAAWVSVPNAESEAY